MDTRQAARARANRMYVRSLLWRRYPVYAAALAAAVRAGSPAARASLAVAGTVTPNASYL